MMDIISLKVLDFESGDPTTGQCNLVIYVEPIPQTRSFSFQILDMNDNKPYFTNPPNETLSFNEVNLYLTN